MTPYFDNEITKIYRGDTLAVMQQLPDKSVDAVVTSPPYFCACDYIHPDQYGLEPTIEEYLAKQVEVFGQVRRLLKHGGVCWIVIGDTSNNISPIRGKGERRNPTFKRRRNIQSDALEKSILGVPFKLADRLQADGWLHRNTLIWDKVTSGAIANSDTAPQTHEYVLQMARWDKRSRPMLNCKPLPQSVFRILPVSDPLHPCPFPPALADRLISAASKLGQTILDPYAGSGTTLSVAQQMGRKSIGIELNPDYADIAAQKCSQLPIFSINEAIA
jgi:DNA modification methylase